MSQVTPEALVKEARERLARACGLNTPKRWVSGNPARDQLVVILKNLERWLQTHGGDK